ncbi:MAG TPA: AAA family ATPase, partial [Pseudomonas sp.]
LEQVPENCDIAFIFNPKLNALELLRTLCDELHIDVPANVLSLKVLVDRLNAHLLASNARGRKTVLIVDEAQNLSNEVLELLRLLTNLETSQRKLLQIILLGQPELRERLAEQQMLQLAQRIVARYHLEPLSRLEVTAYVQHRLAVAGARFNLFPPKVLERLYQLSGGTPRLINLICDRALLGAYTQGQPLVDMATLTRAAHEVQGQSISRRGTPSRRPRTVSTALAVALVASLGVAVALQQGTPRPGLGDAVPPLVDAGSTALTDAASRSVDLAREAQASAGATGEMATASPVDADADADADAVQIVDATHSVPPPADAAPVVAEAPTPAAADSLPSVIAGPRAEDHWLHEAMAIRALLAQWQIEVHEPTTLDNACQRAGLLGLHCLRMNDGLAALRAHNSPAILELQQADGPDFLATLMKLEQNRATLAVAGELREVTLDSLTRQWNGRYILLWRAPPGGEQRLALGAQGPAVAWLEQRLARWEGVRPSAVPSNVFTAELAERLRHFQRAHALKVDGVAGPMTLARLATLTDPEAPVLALPTLARQAH